MMTPRVVSFEGTFLHQFFSSKNQSAVLTSKVR